MIHNNTLTDMTEMELIHKFDAHNHGLNKDLGFMSYAVYHITEFFILLL